MNGGRRTTFDHSVYPWWRRKIESTQRPYWKNKDESPSGFYDTIDDAAMIVEKAKTLPRVDTNRVVLYGGAGETFLCGNA